MHFALPPRKTSHPPPYARAAARSPSTKRRKQLQIAGYLFLVLLSSILVFLYFTSATPIVLDDGTVAEDATVVIVTVLDQSTMSEEYMRTIKTNRDDYAARHGYKNFYTNTTTYKKLVHGSPASWSIVPALRHALTLYPEVDYLWALSANAIITAPSLSLYSHILARLPTLMQKDIPIVPPDSVIHTFSHLKPSEAHLILSQDIDNIAHTSFILRNTATLPRKTPGEGVDHWSQYLLDVWFDPLYRAYVFQKAENHALEHVVQWHPTILANIVMIPQRLINSYNYASSDLRDAESGRIRRSDSKWQEGDLIVNLKGCAEGESRDCEFEMSEYFEKWKKEIHRLDGKTTEFEQKAQPRAATKKEEGHFMAPK